ncbi:patatin-like phospholipase family protein [Erythrobacter litoralis]|uniref:Putative lipoprotein n=1 Tax=Erythrobacter litoralis (strain HTCC2594) TaxID=314225 RepID=Q2N8L7_ERYLH|nr:patatin-like phospholipase family protein [Erythrobacter litoralis]ABC63974.1 putative lipoprotein [Erythrobacter litoralis HTCC2594]
MRNWVLGTLGAASLALGGCSINQKAPVTAEAEMCNFVKHSLAVAIPDSSAPDAQLSEFAAEIEKTLSSYDETNLQLEEESPPETGSDGEEIILPGGVLPPFPKPAPREYTPAKMLFLSGGSEHGAYGAGILKGWGGDGRMPEFQVVTGISTGSILSSFAFVGKGDFAADGYTIDSEKQLLNVYSAPKDGKPDMGNFLDLLKKGAFADLIPLRNRVEGFLTKDYTATDWDGSAYTTTVLHEVARRHMAGKRLFVGAVDVDTGIGTAFDMGDMATRYDTARMQSNTAKAEKWLGCYVEAIIASSSTPMAAPPVFVDNTMYIDGGARFGLFGNTVIRAVGVHHEKYKDRHESHPDPHVYAVIDGTLQLPTPACPKADPAECSGDPPEWTSKGGHKDWNIFNLAMRSERILVNQVYRFSAESVEQEACNGHGCFNFLRMEPDLAEFGIALPAPLNAGHTGKLTCAEWTRVDIETDNPIQFHKRYMRCLIKYGEKKVKEADWKS